MHRTDEAYAYSLDSRDPLSHFRDRFYLNPSEIYMDGNSLGLLSVDAEASLMRILDEWKRLGINGWMRADKPWFTYAEALARECAPLVGAGSEEVILHASTTVNIHALIATFYSPQGEKRKILIEKNAFPTDRYAVQSQLILKGFDAESDLTEVTYPEDAFLDEGDIIDAMTWDVALIFLPSVLYRSGQLLNIARLAKEAHRRGIVIGFDCSHSVGAVPHSLSDWQVDYACWCTYKYCNSGPGGVAGLYVNKKHFSKEPALAGWFGSTKERQFDMSHRFERAQDAGAWQTGTPHILSLAPLEGSLRIINDAGISAIRSKSLRLTGYLIYLVREELVQFGFEIGTPLEEERRGGHVALTHANAIQINEALKAKGIVSDFRLPNIIRFAPVALYNSFHDVWQVIGTIKRIMETGEYLNYGTERGIVA
ncbi:MAG: kynureninase [candidate division KSB1 bacterium]|jgi:kynureninase|nr:kynureninase [candidate division KSB1 bacterium]